MFYSSYLDCWVVVDSLMFFDGIWLFLRVRAWLRAHATTTFLTYQSTTLSTHLLRPLAMYSALSVNLGF